MRGPLGSLRRPGSVQQNPRRRRDGSLLRSFHQQTGHVQCVSLYYGGKRHWSDWHVSLRCKLPCALRQRGDRCRHVHNRNQRRCLKPEGLQRFGPTGHHRVLRCRRLGDGSSTARNGRHDVSERASRQGLRLAEPFRDQELDDQGTPQDSVPLGDLQRAESHAVRGSWREPRNAERPWLGRQHS